MKVLCALLLFCALVSVGSQSSSPTRSASRARSRSPTLTRTRTSSPVGTTSPSSSPSGTSASSGSATPTFESYSVTASSAASESVTSSATPTVQSQSLSASVYPTASLTPSRSSTGAGTRSPSPLPSSAYEGIHVPLALTGVTACAPAFAAGVLNPLSGIAACARADFAALLSLSVGDVWIESLTSCGGATTAVSMTDGVNLVDPSLCAALLAAPLAAGRRLDAAAAAAAATRTSSNGTSAGAFFAPCAAGNASSSSVAAAGANATGGAPYLTPSPVAAFSAAGALVVTFTLRVQQATGRATLGLLLSAIAAQTKLLVSQAGPAAAAASAENATLPPLATLPASALVVDASVIGFNCSAAAAGAGGAAAAAAPILVNTSFWAAAPGAAISSYFGLKLVPALRARGAGAGAAAAVYSPGSSIAVRKAVDAGNSLYYAPSASAKGSNVLAYLVIAALGVLLLLLGACVVAICRNCDCLRSTCTSCRTPLPDEEDEMELEKRRRVAAARAQAAGGAPGNASRVAYAPHGVVQ